MFLLESTLESIEDFRFDPMNEARRYVDKLLKPVGSLGRLEDVAIQIAGITGHVRGKIEKKNIIVFAGDNGVYEENVSSFPQDVSLLVAKTMAQGISGVSVLAKNAGAGVTIVDLGLKGEVDDKSIINNKIRMGTSNITKGPAMTREETVTAIEKGIEITQRIISEDNNLIGTGEIGICNTTTSSAVLAALTGKSVDLLTGRGAGLSSEGLENKIQVIKKSLEVNNPDPSDPIDVISKVGGFDIAGLVGCYLGAAVFRTPIVIDGFISGVAALAAARLNPLVKNFMIPSHLSEEPGAKIIMEELGLEPMLNMKMRLGEGTGCALAFNLVEAALAMINKMGSFADIGM